MFEWVKRIYDAEYVRVVLKHDDKDPERAEEIACIIARRRATVLGAERLNQDPYGSDIPSRIPRPSGAVPTGEPIPSPRLPPEYPAYLRPIPVNTRDVGAVLEGQINELSPGVQRWLYSTWNAESEAIKYQEIRNALRDGELNEAWIARWQQDYSEFVNDVLVPTWVSAGEVGSAVLAEGILEATGVDIPFAATGQRLSQWVTTRGGQLILGSGSFTDVQRTATRNLLHHYIYEVPIGPREMSRILRPCIGLTPRATAAVAKFRDSLVEAGELTGAQITHQVQNYAGRLHRLRAERIARTEVAFAYNYAGLETARQAVDEGVYAETELLKQFLAAPDERTCPWCGELDGSIIGLEDTFPGVTARIPNVFTPPVHPNCRCTILYVTPGEL